MEFVHNDSTSANLPFGFDFPFYNNSFDHIIVSANGWLSFTSHSSAWNNTSLPNNSAPENLIAGFWDDLDPLQGDGQVWVWSNMTDSLVVSFIDVEHYGSTYGIYSYQVILQHTGNIAFQYLEMIGITYSATIGIQNQNKTIGLQVAYNQGYVHNNLRVDIFKPWLELETNSGIVAGGETDSVAIVVDTEGLPIDTYYYEIALTSNDPIQLYTEIPVFLHVIEVDESVENLNISVDNNAITLSWDSAGENTLYSIYRSSVPYFSCEEGELIGQTTECVFIDESAAIGDVYFYQVVVNW